MTAFFFAILPAANAFTVLGAGTTALLGGDLTDPENNGSDVSGGNFNWVTINSSSEPYWNAEGSFNIFDNQVGANDAKWCCEPAPQWIAVKFDKPYVLTHFTIAAGNDAPERDPTRWRIDGSNDGTTWTTIYEWNAGISVFSQRLEVLRFDGAGVDFPSPAPYLWFRYFAVTTDATMHQVNELELFGVPTVVVKNFAVDHTLIAPSEPIILSWEVDPRTTNITIGGLGDVTARTINGAGSISLAPGPGTTTTYVMSAVHPDTTAQQAVTVTVTDQPIIRTFAANPPIIGPGASSTLSWQVINANTVSLGSAPVGLTGSLVVTPASTTAYVLTAGNSNGSASTEINVTVVEPGVPINNEFMADNDGAQLVDEDRDASDWIELHNPSAATAQLEGYSLTDDPANLRKWAFPPGVTLAPGAFMIVFASGKDRASNNAPLHTNFSLDAGGEYLALVKPDGVTIVSQFGTSGADYPEQDEGVSFGLFGNPPAPGYFQTATPGASNSGGFAGYVKDTKFSVNRGFFSTPQTVTISCATPGASIRYTIDGSWPSETAGTLVTGPVSVTRTTVLRAIAFKAGSRSSNVDTHTYIFVDDVVTQTAATTQSIWGLPATWGTQTPDYGMDPNVVNPHGATIRNDLKTVPTLSVVLDPQAMFGPSGIYANPNSSGAAWERATSLELIDPAHPNGSGDFQLNCGIRIQGGAFRGFNLTPKKSFRVLFKGAYGPTKLRFPLFGPDAADEFDTLILRMESNDGYQWDNRTDVQYARDEFGRRTALDLGIPSAHGRFLHLYINGVYWGIYNVVERPDSSFGEQYFGAKKEEWDGINFGTATNEGSTVPWNTMVSLVSPITTAPNEPARTAAFMKVQGRNPDGSRNAAWANYLNVDNYIDYLLVNWFMGNNDWPHRNYYTGRERDLLDPPPLKGSRTSEGMHFFMWDAETSMGINSSNDKTGDISGVAVPYGHLRNSLEFRVRVGDRAYRALFNGGALTAQPCLDRYAAVTRDHRSILIPELARWGDQHGVLRTLPQWEAEYNDVRNNWLAVRAPAFVSVLKGANLYPQTDAPTFSQRGGAVSPTTPVTMATNADRIYYTFDGTDPRLLGGAANPSARVATFGGGGPVPVTYVNTGFIWKYLDNGSNQGTAWKEPGFNDSAWASGPSSLGYGSEGEGAGTTVSFGPDPNNRYRTTYFRTTVNIPAPETFVQFLLRLKYDDGAAVYLNGAEIVRTPNLPAGAGYNVLATSGVADETSWKDYIIPVTAFHPGTNTIAAEVHQATSSSSDIRFDMFLRGEVSSGGANVTDPIFFAQPTLVKARAFNSGTGEWSPIDEVFFSVDTIPADASNLVVSEFSYQPGVPLSPAERAISTDRDAYEFIELMNISNRTIDLTGVSFASAIMFTFPAYTLLPPGGRIVVGNNRLAFLQRYADVAGGITFAGEFDSGSLSNDGERILVTSSVTGVIHDFTYDDKPPWPTAADGDGFSLVLIAPRSNPDPHIGANWRTSTVAHGTPGASDAMTYAEWKIVHGAGGDDYADADRDGWNQFAEFAMGTPPEMDANDCPVTARLFPIGNTTYGAIDIRRNLAAEDEVALRVESSVNLTNWIPDAIYVGETRTEDGAAAIITYRTAQPVSANQRIFLRATFFTR
jgi:hypothetical protein